MMRPEMVLFDYGQTLFDEVAFDGVRGTRAVLAQCAEQPVAVTAEKVQAMADSLNCEMGRLPANPKEDLIVEIHNHSFCQYLYEYFDVKMKADAYTVEQVFWDHAAPGQPTAGIADFLGFLWDHSIRTGVISNIAFSAAVLKQRIDAGLPQHRFEFCLASSEYIFRKPHRRIFELALRKAKLAPHQVWYCGDHPQRDVEGAARLGITPVWYTGASKQACTQPQCPHHRIETWSQLQEKIRFCTAEEE